MHEKAPAVTERKMRCDEAVRWLSGHRGEAIPLAVARHTARYSFCRTFADEMSRRQTSARSLEQQVKNTKLHLLTGLKPAPLCHHSASPSLVCYYSSGGVVLGSIHPAGWTGMARTDDVSWPRVTACAYRNGRALRDHSPGRRTSTGLDEQCDWCAGSVGGCRWKPDPAPEPERTAFANVASLTPGDRSCWWNDCRILY